MPFFLYWTSLNFFACLCWLVPTLLAKLPVNFYAFQKGFLLASSNLFQSELKSAKVSFKRHLNSFIYTYFTFFIPQSICPKSFILLAFLFMQKYREKTMDKKKAKKPTDPICFHGTIKYTNGSHGYLSVFFVFVLFPAEMWPTWKKS